jgi:ubiquinone/menaquinone biosynthesis C-methylase UbiE
MPRSLSSRTLSLVSTSAPLSPVAALYWLTALCLLAAVLLSNFAGTSLQAQEAAAPAAAAATASQSAGQEKRARGAATQAAPAQPRGEKIPPARPRYMGRWIAQTMSFHGAPWLIRDNREDEERTSLVIPQLDLKPGMVVCDMGSGNGYYTLAMAPLVAPGGKVIAVDIQQEMLHLLKLRADAEQIKNIDLRLGSVIDPRLEPGTVDLLLMVDVYHEFSHPQQMLAAIRTSLAPGGRVALLEYREEDPLVPIKPEHKMSKKQILREYTANGFKLVQEYDELPWQHMMFFEADPGWKPRRSEVDQDSTANQDQAEAQDQDPNSDPNSDQDRD